MISDLAVVL